MNIPRVLPVLAGLLIFLPALQADGPDSDAKSATSTPGKNAEQRDEQKDQKKEDAKNWQPLFDGKTLEGWKQSDFYGKSEVAVKDGMIVMDPTTEKTPSAIMAGVTATRKIPKVNYEVSLQAQRVDGTDFFCGLTFPVGDKYCSLIIGGWGGGVVGLSSLNGMDASQNETTLYREYKNGKWYPVKLRVTGQRITAWIDGENVVDVDISETELSTRLEVEWSKPFGIATYETVGAIRDLKIRELPPKEVKQVNSEDLGKS